VHRLPEGRSRHPLTLPFRSMPVVLPDDGHFACR